MKISVFLVIQLIILVLVLILVLTFKENKIIPLFIEDNFSNEDESYMENVIIERHTKDQVIIMYANKLIIGD
jgi:hypothetical protein